MLENATGFKLPEGYEGNAERRNTYVPTADVVEVVRCIDCQYWDGRGYRGYSGRCEAPINGLIRDYTNYDDFCSYGERKERG